ncbi:MAG: thermonuclease family protein [Carnobacterium sp.]|uniref:thermonuclease family protein n=1 Tax=Carnobacterium sp. TaxID=48221 RepID=UPI0033150EDC
MKINKKIVSGIIALILLFTGSFVIEKKQETPGTLTQDQTAIELVRTIDGDTIVFTEDGEEKKLRLLLIDTPESSTTKTGSAQLYGTEAKAFLTNYLEGKELSIEYDPAHEKIDDYDRVLAYLYADGELIQEVMVEKGLARVGYENGDELYLNKLEEAEQEAEAANVNIWSIDGYVGEYGFNKME